LGFPLAWLIANRASSWSFKGIFSECKTDGILWHQGGNLYDGKVRRISINLHHKEHTDHTGSVPPFFVG